MFLFVEKRKRCEERETKKSEEMERESKDDISIIFGGKCDQKTN